MIWMGEPRTKLSGLAWTASVMKLTCRPANASELRSALERYVGHARKTSSGRATRTKVSSGRNQDSAQIRQWARDNGYAVNSRGRIQAEIQEAYQKANS